jgi:uncharacterized repeat protein (TIGR03803 family)
LYSFGASATDGIKPVALIKGSDGNLYGITAYGGGSNCSLQSYTGYAGCGTVFRLTPDGTETVLHSFGTNVGDGTMPTALVEAPDGTFYGTTAYGGDGSDCPATATSPMGCGTVFKLTADGVESIVYSYSSLVVPPLSSYLPPYIPTGLVVASDGDLRVIEKYGANGACQAPSDPNHPGTPSLGCGGFDRFSTAGTHTIFGEFNGGVLGIPGAFPVALLEIPDASGPTFLAMTEYSGVSSVDDWGGLIAKIGPTGSSVFHAFQGGATDGLTPTAMTVAPDGTLYVTTAAGGTGDSGTLYAIDPSGAGQVLYSFLGAGSGTTPADAAMPNTVIVGSDGNLYGTSAAGGDGFGTVFKVMPSGSESVLRSLQGEPGDLQTATSLVQLGDFLYVAGDGGTNGAGAIATVSTNAMTAPQDVVADAGRRRVRLTWSAVAGAAGYDIYMGTTPGGEAVKPDRIDVTGTSTVVKRLSRYKTYYFEVAAVAADGTEGPHSAEVSAKPLRLY